MVAKEHGELSKSNSECDFVCMCVCMRCMFVCTWACVFLSPYVFLLVLNQLFDVWSSYSVTYMYTVQCPTSTFWRLTHFGACQVILMFSNPLNSDMDFKSFISTRTYIYMHIGDLSLWSHLKDFCRIWLQRNCKVGAKPSMYQLPTHLVTTLACV